MVVGDIHDYLESHEFIGNVVYILFGMALAVIVYQALGFALSTEDPIVVVVSCSMLPNLDRGDMLILKGVDVGELKAGLPPRGDIPGGDIIVYVCPSNSPGCPPGNKLIVHRLYKINEDGTLVSWGDHNPSADAWAVKREWLKGKVVYRVPLLGEPKLILTDLLNGRILTILVQLLRGDADALLSYKFTC
ncbi:MAG: signal peptidase I [archaeon]|nr:signal peptidase I [archaeon]